VLIDRTRVGGDCVLPYLNAQDIFRDGRACARRERGKQLVFTECERNNTLSARDSPEPRVERELSERANLDGFYLCRRLHAMLHWDVVIAQELSEQLDCKPPGLVVEWTRQQQVTGV
jgi:hypothetical protein